MVFSFISDDLLKSLGSSEFSHFWPNLTFFSKISPPSKDTQNLQIQLFSFESYLKNLILTILLEKFTPIKRSEIAIPYFDFLYHSKISTSKRTIAQFVPPNEKCQAFGCIIVDVIRYRIEENVLL